MEDRITTGLYLELGNVDPDRFATRRAPELLARAGVDRVTWWAQQRPGPDELPMAVDDGTLLGVAEVDDELRAHRPALPGTTARHFRRYRRPSQGVLTGRPTTGLLVVWISPQAARARPGPAGLGRLRPHPAHRRRVGPRLHPHHPLREHAPAPIPASCTSTSSTPTTPRRRTWAWPGTWRRYFGGARTEEFERWADWKAAHGQVVYCNTFRLLGRRRRPPAPGAAGALSVDVLRPRRQAASRT